MTNTSVDEPISVPSQYGLSVPTIITLSLQITFMVVIIFGNTLVIIAVMGFRILRDATGILVANLAIADLIMGIAMPFQVAFNFSPSLEKNKYLCIMRYDIILFACNVSLHSLSCTVVDRYFAIVRPLRYADFMIERRAYGLVACIWLFDIAIFLIPLSGVDNWDAAPLCLYELVMDKTFRFFSAVHSLMFATLMGLIYLRIYVIVRHHANQIHALNYPTEEIVFRGQMNTIISIVVAFFHVSWLPFIIVQLTMYDNKDVTKEKVVLANFLVFLGITYSMVNPIIYAWKNTYYRAAFKKMLRCHNRNSVYPGNA